MYILTSVAHWTWKVLSATRAAVSTPTHSARPSTSSPVGPPPRSARYACRASRYMPRIVTSPIKTLSDRNDRDESPNSPAQSFARRK